MTKDAETIPTATKPYYIKGLVATRGVDLKRFHPRGDVRPIGQYRGVSAEPRVARAGGEAPVYTLLGRSAVYTSYFSLELLLGFRVVGVLGNPAKLLKTRGLADSGGSRGQSTLWLFRRTLRFGFRWGSSLRSLKALTSLDEF